MKRVMSTLVAWVIAGMFCPAACNKANNTSGTATYSTPLAVAETIRLSRGWKGYNSAFGRSTLLMGRLKYEMRLSPSSELLIRAIQPSASPTLSDNVWLIPVGVTSKNTPREASTQEWDAARTPKSDKTRSFTGGTHNNTVTYGGKSFVSSGPAVRLVMPSADGKWLAVLSETIVDQGIGRRAARKLVPMPPFLSGDGSTFFEGDFFLDIYDVGSGARVASNKAHYDQSSGTGSGLGLDEACWLDDKYFVAPLDNERRTFFVGSVG
jgi:hypothetical protein